MFRIARSVVLATLMAAVFHIPATAQIMVVRAQGPSAGAFPVGALLRANRSFQLQAGDHLTFLDGRATRECQGPGRCTPRGLSPDAESALVKLLAPVQAAGSRIGAARGMAWNDKTGSAANATPAGIWQIDVASPGDFCAAPGLPVELWRRDTGAAAVLITRIVNDSKRTLTWGAGEASLTWPADLPLSDGEAYLISTTDGMDAGLMWRAVDPPRAKTPA
jgi:hypothetical protein